MRADRSMCAYRLPPCACRLSAHACRQFKARRSPSAMRVSIVRPSVSTIPGAHATPPPHTCRLLDHLDPFEAHMSPSAMRVSTLRPRVSTIRGPHAALRNARVDTSATRVDHSRRACRLFDHGCRQFATCRLLDRACRPSRCPCRPCSCAYRLLAAHVDLTDAHVDPSQSRSAPIARVSTVQSRMSTAGRGGQIRPRARRPLKGELISEMREPRVSTPRDALVDHTHVRVGSSPRVSTLLMCVSTPRKAGRP